jgi:hypothetical protein
MSHSRCQEQKTTPDQALADFELVSIVVFAIDVFVFVRMWYGGLKAYFTSVLCWCDLLFTALDILTASSLMNSSDGSVPPSTGWLLSMLFLYDL